jgi:tRNA A37 threonylcarbamoyltransferase TsaD
MAHTEKDEVLLGGGVASNKRLQDMVKKMAEDRDARFYVPSIDLCIDNGAMIAWLGLLMYKNGIRLNVENSYIDQRFRTDMVDVNWRD